MPPASKGVGLAATLIGRFPADLSAALSLAAEPVDRRSIAAIANLSFSCWRWSASSMGARVAITAENFTSAIGTVIFVAYLSALCQNPLTHRDPIALLTALAAVGRLIYRQAQAYVAKAVGLAAVLRDCVVVAIPSLILLAALNGAGICGLEGRGRSSLHPRHARA